MAENDAKLQNAGLAASVVTAFAASICCIGPIVAATLGLTSLAGLVRYEPLRPYLTALTLGFLGLAFYLSYRRAPEQACEPGSLCAAKGPDRIQRINRIVLWIAATIILAVLTFPTWSGWVLG